VAGAAALFDAPAAYCGGGTFATAAEGALFWRAFVAVATRTRATSATGRRTAANLASFGVGEV